jgi:5-formyltetrahydrofolate cyclo-ligase
MPGSHGFIPSSAEELLRRRVKAELRKRMLGLRTALPAISCRERSERIAVRLLSMEPIANARAVALFWPIEPRHEVDLRALDTRLRERDVRVAYPTVDTQSRTMSFRFVTDPLAMEERTLYGAELREPSASDPEAAPGQLDAIVVPALALDPTGQRIGYGAGYYDSTLPRFVPPAASIAVSFDFQLVAEIPSTEGDVGVQYVVTDARVLSAE